ncbi:hypothetical protein GQ43DRAFT_437170 [Delitschia confertaspora ATCC 74209]|uniref:Uncharacterized protein n=1 Tax=Delitschia confertaspora ATCC 74209 TaxID=1513339 RepID=A0A9P4JU69_9PLEO|nr:hypothetical protein GQ43DRAFT_437170 [Delitschia confertaspora ATCC 74209]
MLSDAITIAALAAMPAVTAIEVAAYNNKTKQYYASVRGAVIKKVLLNTPDGA